MKKFIIFLLPILFLFSCQKVYDETNEQELSGNLIHEYRNPNDHESVSYCFAINVDDRTYSLTKRVGNNSPTTLKNGNFEKIKLTTKSLSYTYEMKTYTHEVKKNVNGIVVTLEPEKYGVFWLKYDGPLTSAGYTDQSNSKKVELRWK